MRMWASRSRLRMSKLMSLWVRGAVSTSSTKQTRLNLSAQSLNSARSTIGAGMLSTRSCALAASIRICAHSLDVALVGDVDRDDDAADPVGVDPVLDDVGDEVRVRHDQRRPVERLDLGRAGVDLADEPLVGADDDQVADPDAALPQEDQARDEIVGDRLQPEADADRERAGDDGEPLHVEPDLGGRQQHRDRAADIAEDRADRVADPGIEARLRQQAVAEPALHEAGGEQRHAEHDRRRQHRRQRQGDAADGEAEIGGAQRAEPVLRLHAPRLEHGRRGDHDQHQPRDALHDDGDLGEHVAAEAEQRPQRPADLGLGAEQRRGPVLDDDVDQIETAAENGEEDRLIDQEGGERDIAGRGRAEDDQGPGPADRAHGRPAIGLGRGALLARA